MSPSSSWRLPPSFHSASPSTSRLGRKVNVRRRVVLGDVGWFDKGHLYIARFLHEVTTHTSKEGHFTTKRHCREKYLISIEWTTELGYTQLEVDCEQPAAVQSGQKIYFASIYSQWKLENLSVRHFGW